VSLVLASNQRVMRFIVAKLGLEDDVLIGLSRSY
jgi:hypothetical protein